LSELRGREGGDEKLGPLTSLTFGSKAPASGSVAAIGMPLVTAAQAATRRMMGLVSFMVLLGSLLTCQREECGEEMVARREFICEGETELFLSIALHSSAHEDCVTGCLRASFHGQSLARVSECTRIWTVARWQTSCGVREKLHHELSSLTSEFRKHNGSRHLTDWSIIEVALWSKSVLPASLQSVHIGSRMDPGR
jgi:hypothetical protein